MVLHLQNGFLGSRRGEKMGTKFAGSLSMLLARNKARRGVTTLGVGIVLSIASGCVSHWPAVHAYQSADLTEGARPIRSIDILPADVQIWAHPDEPMSESEIGLRFDAAIANGLPSLLATRGYRIAANLGWDGRYLTEGGERWQALTHDQVVETAWALSSYGTAARLSKRADLAPYLPHRLGHVTGSDATLYIGGWGYAGKKKRNPAVTVLKVVAVVVVVAVAVVTVAALLDHGKGGKRGSGKRGIIHRSSGSTRIGSNAVQVGAKLATGVARVAGGIGRAALHISKAGTRVAGGLVRSIDTIHIGIIEPDCFGRRTTHLNYAPQRPDYHAAKGTPDHGPSASFVEMTLIDNRSGNVLWHARQRFPANPKNPKDIEKMMQQMVTTLPAAH